MARDDYQFLVEVCLGQINDWREKAEQWDRNATLPDPLGDKEEEAKDKAKAEGCAWARRACADDLQWHLFILGKAERP